MLMSQNQAQLLMSQKREVSTTNGKILNSKAQLEKVEELNIAKKLKKNKQFEDIVVFVVAKNQSKKIESREKSKKLK